MRKWDKTVKGRKWHSRYMKAWWKKNKEKLEEIKEKELKRKELILWNVYKKRKSYLKK